MHFFIFFLQFLCYFPSVGFPITIVCRNLTYLPTYLPTPNIKKQKTLDNFRTRETGSKQSSSPSHSRRDTLIADRGAIKWEGCKMLKGHQAQWRPTFDQGWGTRRPLKALGRTRCSASKTFSAVTMQRVEGAIPRERAETERVTGRSIIYRTCTKHYGNLSFSFATYLFSLLGQSPIIWQWEHREDVQNNKVFKVLRHFS